MAGVLRPELSPDAAALLGAIHRAALDSEEFVLVDLGWDQDRLDVATCELKALGFLHLDREPTVH